MSGPEVVRWGERGYFHAWRRPDGLLVDLRDYDEAFPPEWQDHLRRLGVPEPVLDSARGSSPVGYALVSG